MNTKPSAGAMRAAKALTVIDWINSRPNDIAAIIDRESGLTELVKTLQAIEDIVSTEQPGMPPLPRQWADVLKRHTFMALNRVAKADNPNTEVKQAYPGGRWS